MVTILFLLYAVTWFAPALVMLHDISPRKAMNTSVIALLKNLPACSIFVVVYVGLGIASLFTFGLALLVVMPVLSLASYTSYRDVFIDS